MAAQSIEPVTTYSDYLQDQMRDFNHTGSCGVTFLVFMPS